MSIIDVDFCRSWLIMVDPVDLWPVDPKTGFERPCQSTLGSPIDFNGNRKHRSEHRSDGKHRSQTLTLAQWRCIQIYIETQKQI